MRPNLEPHFQKFDTNLQLDASRRARIIKAHETLRAALSRAVRVSDTFLQGSYKNHTAIRPLVGDEYDVDVVVVLERPYFINSWNDEVAEPAEVLDWVRRELESVRDYAWRLEVKRRCIRLDYAGDFHLDVVPTLSGGGEVLHIGEGRSWGETNPKGLDTWHTKTNRRLDGSFNALLRMMKRWRDFYELSVPSVTLAVMLGNYLPDLPRSGGNTREAWVVEAFDALHRHFVNRTQVPVVKNPSLPREDLARDLGWPEFRELKGQVEESRNLVREARQETQLRPAVERYRDLFGDAFPFSV